MTYDVNVPPSLRKIQEWFASIITRPIDHDSQMIPISPSGKPMTEEAQVYVSPSFLMTSDERIQIYNQQYWWRLLKCLHESFPLVTRLFGYREFNQLIGFPYLHACPPNHWSLNLLGHRLVNWLENNYHSPDKSLIIDSAKIDLAYNEGFNAANCAYIESSQLTHDFVTQTLYLQPSIRLFSFDYDLLTFREVFIKESGDFWIDCEFPPLLKEKKYFFVIYRSVHYHMLWKEISEGEYYLLSLLEKGACIENICDALENNLTSAAYEHTLSNLSLWFKEWAANRWLTQEKF